ncbi:hypothetical protein IJD44_03965 [bacterium]|nr:hypothetical protein [bacterium]
MQIKTITNNNPSFKSIWTNKAVLKGLETISEHSTSFIAATSLIMASGVRTLTISKTPNIDEENKKHLMANSILSGLTKFLMVEAIAIPIENAVKKIDKSPEKFLNQNTINSLKEMGKNLSQSNKYNFATQLLKLSTGLITAIPKSMLTIALLPIFMNKLFPDKDQTKKQKQYIHPKYEINKVFEPIQSKQPSFKGGLSNLTAKGIGKIIDNNFFQNFVQKNINKSSDIARNISISTDVLLTASFVNRIRKNKNIKEERKKTLIYNNIITTGLSIIGGYSVDKAVQKGTKKFIDKFSEINKNDPKLQKYIAGINIIRPTLIFAGIYYVILPMISAYLADKTDKVISKKETI